MSSDRNISATFPDFLTPLASRVVRARPDAYRALVVRDASPGAARDLLADVKPAQLLSVPIQNAGDADALLAGLWLWHDALHECHLIVQDLIGPTGSFWHAIMHRREGDFSNAKYWYARCADHRALRLVSAMALDAVGRETSDPQLLHIVSGEYNPESFVDLVEEIAEVPDDPRHAAAVRIQQIEWEALFHHCAYEAAGAVGEEGGMI
ncbi:MAG TPA: hypothetical protein VFC78_10000 [Tepidisphaeraceae bacterium]|nr:hypothetical protein [Tepidisphaeraceae bacterium]